MQICAVLLLCAINKNQELLRTTLSSSFQGSLDSGKKNTKIFGATSQNQTAENKNLMKFANC